MNNVLWATLLWQIVDYIKELADIRNNRSPVVTQTAAWIGGIVLVAVGAHAAVTASFVPPGADRPLGALDWPSVVLYGLMAASLASSLVDVKQAVDTHDTAAKPALLPRRRAIAAPEPATPPASNAAVYGRGSGSYGGRGGGAGYNAGAAKIVVRLIDETIVAGKRLGRHVEHDARSLLYPAGTAPVKAVSWVHHGRVLNQGRIGDCTGNAAVDCLMCDPLWTKGRRLSERDAVHVYELATTLDNIPGSYPPDDTGSSGVAAAKACQQLNLIAGYTHAFGIDHAVGALMVGPVMFGTDWHAGMDNPDPTGLVSIGGAVRGGHEYAGIGYDPASGLIECLNSWGPGWGRQGTFFVHRDDMAVLLDAGGDVTALRGT